MRPTTNQWQSLPDNVQALVAGKLDLDSQKQLSLVDKATPKIVKTAFEQQRTIKIKNARDLRQVAQLFPHMTKLDASGANLGDDDIRFIVDRFPNLQTLNLSDNNVGTEGAKALAKSTSLQTLNLRSNRVGDGGAKALAKSTSLQTLDLSLNRVGDEGRQALMQALFNVSK